MAMTDRYSAGLWQSPLCLAAVFVFFTAIGSAVAADREAPFLKENDTAMARMMTGMAIRPSGDVDQDFAGMMIPHHQGAIDMALAELRYGRNEQLRRIAQEIIVEQQQEIIAMHMALGQPLPPSAAAQTQVSPAEPAAAQDQSSIPHAAMSMSSMKK